MELNTRGRYAIMAMADLAKHGSEGSVPLPAIAERQHISLAYLEQLFVPLRRAGLVASARGRAGGYRLAHEPGEIRLSEIMLVVEEPVRMTRCAGEAGVGCAGAKKCLTHDLWTALGDHILGFLDDTTLQDLLDGSVSRRPRPVRATRPEAMEVAAK